MSSDWLGTVSSVPVGTVVVYAIGIFFLIRGSTCKCC